MESYCKSLLCDLENLSLNINTYCCPLLQTILCKNWILRIEKEIIKFCKKNRLIDPIPPFNSPIIEPFLTFRDRDELFRFNQRVVDIVFADKRNLLHNKLGKICRKDSSVVRAIIFELGVTGEFAKDSKLKDIDVRVVPERATNVDALIEIDDRSILVEVTLISRRLGGRTKVGVLSSSEMMKQVEKKLSNKATKGKQLALSTKDPAILVLGLPEFGADLITAKSQIDDCLNLNKYEMVSAVIISDSYLFRTAHVIYNENARYTLSESEKEYLNKTFRETNC